MPVGTRTTHDEVATDLHDRLRGFVARRINDPHAADDVSQEVLLRLHRHLGDLRGEERLDAFAYRIARNAIIDHYRARASAREEAAAPDDLARRIEIAGDIDGQADDPNGRQELAGCLLPLLRRMPEPYREALTLTDLGSMSQAQAAEVAGISLPGMKSRVQRARAQLHESLTSCCEVTLDRTEHITAVRRSGTCACSGE